MLKKEFFTQRFVVDLQAHAFLSIDCFFLSLFIDICVLSEKNHLVPLNENEYFFGWYDIDAKMLS